MLDVYQLEMANELKTDNRTLFSNPVASHHRSANEQHTVYDRYGLACNVDQDTLDRKVLLDSTLR